MTVCKNCTNPIEHKFCGYCGQSLSMNNRIKLDEFLIEIFHSIFHTGNGLFHTLKTLTLTPEKVVEGYIEGQRKTFFSPVKLILISGVIYAIVSLYVNKNLNDTESDTIDYYFEHYKYLVIFGPIALATLFNWLLYKKKHFNIGEHFIVSIYVQSIIYLSSSLFMLINNIFDLKLILISVLFSLLYYIYSMTRIYKKNNPFIGIVFNFVIYILITLLFMIPFVLKQK
jgi:hypothetical protein